MFILFDIGGTKMRIGLSTDGFSLDKTLVIDTPITFDAGMTEFKKAAESLMQGKKIKAVAGGIAGPFSHKVETLLASPNLKDWVGKPIQTDLEKFFAVPVFIENDAALVGLGEAMRGGGRGAGIVAYVTVSTGVGGAKIVNGRIDPRSIGFEPGHEIIDIDNTVIPDAVSGTLESYVSGAGLAKRVGKKPKEIDDPKIWDDLARILAYGLNNVAVFWSPDVVVLGGSMIVGDPAISVEKTQEYLKKILTIYPEIPKIKKAELGDLGGLYGALELLKQQVI